MDTCSSVRPRNAVFSRVSYTCAAAPKHSAWLPPSAMAHVAFEPQATCSQGPSTCSGLCPFRLSPQHLRSRAPSLRCDAVNRVDGVPSTQIRVDGVRGCESQIEGKGRGAKREPARVVDDVRRRDL